MTKRIELQDIPGVGPATAKKLKDAGFDSIEAVAVSSPFEIASTADISDETAQKIINAARQSVGIGGFATGNQVLEQNKFIGKLSFGNRALDDLMGGGIETNTITELYGESDSGKTQIGHQMAVNVQLPKNLGGLEGSTIIIDTENTFVPEKIKQIVAGVSTKNGIEYVPEEFLENIHAAKARNSNHQMLLIDTAIKLADELKNTSKPVRLLVVDSLTGHFSAEYAGRSALANMQQKLNKHMHDLMKFANLYNAAVLVINQTVSNHSAFFGNSAKSIGGQIVKHNAPFRLYLRKSNGEKRIARLVDSPNLPEGEAVFLVTAEGLKD